jgi:hypothetical protein
MSELREFRERLAGNIGMGTASRAGSRSNSRGPSRRSSTTDVNRTSECSHYSRRSVPDLDSSVHRQGDCCYHSAKCRHGTSSGSFRGPVNSNNGQRRTP